MSELRIYGAWAGNPKGAPEDPAKCIEEVWGESFRMGHQCQRKRGHGKGGLYCAQHDPCAIEAKREAKRRIFAHRMDVMETRAQNSIVGSRLRTENPSLFAELLGRKG